MSLSAPEAEALFGRMLDGAMTDAVIATTLVDMAERGESADELVGAVRAIRQRMQPVRSPPGAMDVAGTGGDGHHSLNISTAVALVVAACGVPMAKCGNRAASSLAGTADTLEALGLDIARATDMAEATLADPGIAFIFAPRQVPILARVAPIRKALGRRTLFNLVGPALNIASVRRQLVGVPGPGTVALYAEALEQLGCERAMVVAGEEGLDELSIAGPSRIACIGFAMADEQVTPEDAGLPRHPLGALRGGDAAHNAAALRRLLLGEPGAYRDAVLFNAAAALIVAGEVHDWRHGAEEAAEVIDKGLANTLLDCWITAVT